MIPVAQVDLHGKVPENWACVDCGVNTAPGFLNRADVEQALARDWENKGVQQTFDDHTEVYTVKPKVWKAAGMEPMGGCLCIGCLEKRLGRQLTPKDFMHNHAFATIPGSARLRNRRDGR
jgi:hypothetical protein